MSEARRIYLKILISRMYVTKQLTWDAYADLFTILEGK